MNFSGNHPPYPTTAGLAQNPPGQQPHDTTQRQPAGTANGCRQAPVVTANKR